MFQGLKNHRPVRLIASTMSTIMLINTIPQNAYAKPRKAPAPVSRLKNGLTQTPDAALRQKIDQIEAERKKASQPDVRLLSDKEEQAIKGRGPLRNKYFSGTMPWHRTFHDVNLNTGNLFKSFTDVQVAPGKGAGLALQRTYNSNEEKAGAFGIGWTHAYDIRMDETVEKDPSTGDDIVLRKDFFGGEHKYCRDADGLYTPPAYLYDELDSTYDKSLVNGPAEIVDDTQHGMDGTAKHFVPDGTDADGSPSASRICDYIEDRHGNRTNLTYGQTVARSGGGTRKLLTSVTDPSGRALTFTWSNLNNSGEWRITKVTGPQYEVVYAYNAEYNLASVTLDPTGLNRTTTYGYTTLNAGNGNVESGLLTSITDPLGRSVSYTYQHAPDSTGKIWVTKVNEVNAGGVEYWVAPAGLYNYQEFVTTFGITGYTGVSAHFADFQLRTKMFRAQNGQYAQHVWTYDNNNNVLSDYLSNITYYDPVAGGGVSQSSAATVSTYGPHGNVLTQSQTGYPGVTTTEYYDASKYFQKKKITDPMGRVTEFDYFQKAKYVDPANPNNPANVGRQGNVAWVKDAKFAQTGKKFEYDYNTAGQKVWEKNLNDVVSTFEYADTWGNLTKVRQDPTGLNRTTQMTYDVSGKVLSSTDPMNQTSTFAYNSLGQPTSASFPAKGTIAGETISYTYGANGRSESVTDGRGTTTMAYVAGSDRVASVTDPVTGTISYTYTPLGERKTMTAPNGEVTTYFYKGETVNEWMPWLGLQKGPDEWMRNLEKITDPQGRVVQMAASSLGMRAIYFNQAFDAYGNRTAYCVTQYNTTEAGGGDRGRLQEIKTLYRWKSQYGYSWNEKLLSKNNYTYDLNGLRTTNTITDSTNTARTETYAYDELARLTGVAYGDGQTQGYSFDNMGNRLAKTDNVTGNETYTYNNANMLLSRNGQGYSNDADGNTLTGGGRTSTWDSQNRMVQCVYNGKTSNFTYGSDGLRRRMSVTNADGTTTTDYILDCRNVVQEMVKLPGQSNSSLAATYLQGPSGPMYKRGANVADVRWYVYDGLGSVLGEVDINGNLTSTKKHDVYGLSRGITGAPTSKHNFVGQLGHSNEYDINLIYMRARYYDPVIGRFTSEDPSFKGNNWYSYCNNNPVMFADESGRILIIPAILVTILFGMALGAGMYAGQCVSQGKIPDIEGYIEAMKMGALGAVLAIAVALLAASFGIGTGLICSALSVEAVIAVSSMLYIVGDLGIMLFEGSKQGISFLNAMYGSQIRNNAAMKGLDFDLIN